MSEMYKIVPGMFLKFNLLRWLSVPGIHFIGFWDVASASDSYTELAGRVDKCGGILMNRPTQPHNGEQG